ncbi:DUF3891 family protein [Frankia sp. AgB1.9]|uniref:DUF3891 family protein n=1 Tax=unclassified Frankia TaxID=2632575 RepID=UPI001932B282|nr:MULTISPECIES: DUF3891 family protein [unclassified Frankia]MBL7490811.1 DUF3891 family protein [Frankia sp. AgW1.1]MBL7552232.1 DUF3891 family protein [Frankia sp. AgB1.9]MBL7622009.1 DUF3891 family protein [Frankia sp. AgB1.8]
MERPAWGNEDAPALAEHARAATLAARHHDNGWAVWERRPSLDPATRQPTQFHKVGPVEHIPAYRAGVDRAAHGDPWAGLLVSLHAAGLYNGRYGTFRLPELADQSLTAHEQALVTEFLAEMDRLQRDLLGALARRPVSVRDRTGVLRRYLGADAGAGPSARLPRPARKRRMPTRKGHAACPPTGNRRPETAAARAITPTPPVRPSRKTRPGTEHTDPGNGPSAGPERGLTETSP